MARNPTTWSNNDTKPPAAWVGSAKNITAYVNNITKLPAAFIPATKQNTSWGNEAVTSDPWLYDDATQKYDDTPVRGYDYLIPTTNTINGKIPTAWPVVV